MSKLGLILGACVFLITVANAQVALNDKGLYQDKNGVLFTGILESSDNSHGKSVLQIKEGRPEGEAQYYYASGKLMETGYFENGLKTGKWLRYNEAGVTIALAVFNAGKKNGTWLVWDDNGKKLFEMHYTNGEKTGLWYNWDAKGDLISSKDFGTAN